MPILPSQRHLFDVPEDIAYFNAASNTPLLNESRERLLHGILFKRQPGEILPQHYFTDAEIIRKLSAELFGGDMDGYAIISAANYGLSTAARAIEPQLPNGNTILFMAEEFPSSVLTWKRIARQTGATICTVPIPPTGNWTQAIIDKLDERVKVLPLSTCHWMNGAYVDLVAVRHAGIAVALWWSMPPRP